MYEKLDALILEAIRNGSPPLYESLCNGEAERIIIGTRRAAFRVIDGRVQSLRKRGVIAYATDVRAWVVLED